MKQNHRVKVDEEMRSDFKVWLEFLQLDEAVCRPFIDFAITLHADEIQFFTHALGSKRLSFWAPVDVWKMG